MSSFYRDPLHRQIEKIVRERIGTIYAPGERIPTEIELAKEFKVSLQTIRRALGDLVEQGVIDRRRGSGSYARLAPPPGPIALVASVDLSARKLPYVELKLLETCQAALEGAGRDWRLYVGVAAPPDHRTDPSVIRLERDLQTVPFSGAILLSPLTMEAPPEVDSVKSLRRVGRVGEGGGVRVAGSYAGFIRRAITLLEEAGCGEMALLGGASAWVEKGEGDPSQPPLLPWTPESREWLCSQDGRSPVGLIIADPDLVEETVAGLSDFLKAGRLRIVACGFAGEPRLPVSRSISYLDLDLAAVGAGLVEAVTRSEGENEGVLPALLDAWQVAAQ